MLPVQNGGVGGEISFLHLSAQIQASTFWVCTDADSDEKHRVQMVQTPFSFQRQQRKVWRGTFHNRTTTNSAAHLAAPPDLSYTNSGKSCRLETSNQSNFHELAPDCFKAFHTDDEIRTLVLLAMVTRVHFKADPRPLSYLFHLTRLNSVAVLANNGGMWCVYQIWCEPSLWWTFGHSHNTFCQRFWIQM